MSRPGALALTALLVAGGVVFAEMTHADAG